MHEETQGKLYDLKYPVIGTSDFIVVSTTRPETMLGDTAVAVNANDERYRHLHGAKILLPLMNREIPVIVDELANPEFGTGAVKVTPAHDPNDFQAGLRHDLPQITVIDEIGQDERAGRSRTRDWTASRRARACCTTWRSRACWWASRTTCWRSANATAAKPSSSPAFDAVVRGREPQGEGWQSEPGRARHSGGRGRAGTLHPGKLQAGLPELDDQHSRLVHLAPALVGTPHSGLALRASATRSWWRARLRRSAPSCGSARLEQDADVLDTWFSSGLLPMSAMGWPGKTRDLDAFYPTSLLITGFDILFFWVARMIMMGCHFLADHERGMVPFRDVYIHGLVRDAERQKMSKTKGNVVDPIETIERFGTDATRFTLATMAAPGADIAFSESRTESYRAFANKIWNAARFIFMNVDRAEQEKVWSLREFRPPMEDAARHSRLRGGDAGRSLDSFALQSRRR